MRIGSMFTGVMGLDLAVERATDGRLVWAAESAAFPRRVIRAHRPDAQLFGDVRRLGVRKRLPRIDVLCAGFPCTDISVAGLGGGIEGERSGLWRETARVIGLVRPARALLENVSAIRRRGLDVVLDDLRQLGYAAEWITVDAMAAGAQHYRARWLCVAYPDASDAPELLTGLTADYRAAFVANRGPGGVWALPAEACGLAPTIAPRAMPPDRRRAMLTATGNGVVTEQAQPVADRLYVDGVPFTGGEPFDLAGARVEASAAGRRWPALPTCGVMRGGVIYERPAPVPRALAVEWHRTPAGRMSLPTPTDAASSARHTTKAGAMHPGTTLLDAARIIVPTPVAADAGGTRGPATVKRPGGLPDVAREIYPTPVSSDANGPTVTDNARQGGAALRDVARAIVPTPCAANHRSGLVSDELADRNARPLQEFAARLPGQVSGALNPAWVSALMGWPPGWLDVWPRQVGLFDAVRAEPVEPAEAAPDDVGDDPDSPAWR